MSRVYAIESSLTIPQPQPQPQPQPHHLQPFIPAGTPVDPTRVALPPHIPVAVPIGQEVFQGYPTAVTAPVSTWRNEACDCFATPGGPSLCVYGFFCTSCAYGNNAAHVGLDCQLYGSVHTVGHLICPLASLFLGCQGWSGILTLLGCLITIPLGMKVRGKIREKYNILGAPANDCLLHACCRPCAVTQESNHILAARFGGLTAPPTVVIVQSAPM